MNICVNKSLFQVLVVLLVMLPPVVLPTVVPSLVEIPSQLWLSKCTWTAKNLMQLSVSHVYSYYDSASVLKWPHTAKITWLK